MIRREKGVKKEISASHSSSRLDTAGDVGAYTKKEAKTNQVEGLLNPL